MDRPGPARTRGFQGAGVAVMAVVLVVLVAAVSLAPPLLAPPGTPPPSDNSAEALALAAAQANRAEAMIRPFPLPPPSTGRETYRRRCAVCHGLQGRGDGPQADAGRPPADLRIAALKFKKVPAGTAARPDDLLRTVLAGIPGTDMNPQADLDDTQAWALVSLLLSWRNRPQEVEPTDPPLHIPPPPADFDPEAGAQAWRILKCWECHGPEGKGDGPSAWSFTDIQGRPIAVPDLTAPVPFRSGARPEDLYRTLAMGLDGTPMPGFRYSADPATLWAAVRYVLRIKFRAQVKH